MPLKGTDTNEKALCQPPTAGKVHRGTHREEMTRDWRVATFQRAGSHPWNASSRGMEAFNFISSSLSDFKQGSTKIIRGKLPDALLSLSLWVKPGGGQSDPVARQCNLRWQKPLSCTGLLLRERVDRVGMRGCWRWTESSLYRLRHDLPPTHPCAVRTWFNQSKPSPNNLRNPFLIEHKNNTKKVHKQSPNPRPYVYPPFFSPSPPPVQQPGLFQLTYIYIYANQPKKYDGRNFAYIYRSDN